MLTYRAGRLMDQQWNINGAPDSIRGLVRTIVGDSVGADAELNQLPICH